MCGGGGGGERGTEGENVCVGRYMLLLVSVGGRGMNV